MSGFDKDRSSSGGGDGSDEEDGGVSSPSKKDGVNQESSSKCEKETKRVSVFRFGKAKKKLQLLQSNRRRRKRKGSLVNSGCFGRWGAGEVGCCLSVKQTQTLDSSGESPTSDPNSKEFTYDMLKVFIEKNDFYAEECNPHLDAK